MFIYHFNVEYEIDQQSSVDEVLQAVYREMINSYSKTLSKNNIKRKFYLRIFAYALLTSAILVLEKLKPNSIVLNVKGTDGKEDLEFKSMLTKKVKCIQDRDIDLIEGMGYRKLTESSKSFGIDQVDLI